MGGGGYDKKIIRSFGDFVLISKELLHFNLDRLCEQITKKSIFP